MGRAFDRLERAEGRDGDGDVARPRALDERAEEGGIRDVRVEVAVGHVLGGDALGPGVYAQDRQVEVEHDQLREIHRRASLVSSLLFSSRVSRRAFASRRAARRRDPARGPARRRRASARRSRSRAATCAAHDVDIDLQYVYVLLFPATLYTPRARVVHDVIHRRLRETLRASVVTHEGARARR